MVLTLALAGMASLGLAFVVFSWSLNRGDYRRHPYEIYALVGVSTACGLAAAWLSWTWPTGLLAALSVSALGAVVWYYSVGAKFPRSEVPLQVGDPFPEFSLPDSTGETFDSRSLLGEAAALFLFYRGNW